jgi:hypothetical protein
MLKVRNNREDTKIETEISAYEESKRIAHVMELEARELTFAVKLLIAVAYF